MLSGTEYRYIYGYFPQILDMHRDGLHTNMVFPVHFSLKLSHFSNRILFLNIGHVKELSRNGELLIVSDLLLFLRMIDLGFRNVILVDSSISDRQVDRIVRPLNPDQKFTKLIFLVTPSEANAEETKRILQNLSRKAFIHEVILEFSRLDELSKEQIMQAIAE